MKALVFVIAFWLLMVVGYGQCIYKFVKCDFEPSYKAEVVYGVGVISGLGGILGWFNFGE